jgi:hypothetical protein
MKESEKPYSIDLKNWVDGYYKSLTRYSNQIIVLFIAILMVSIISVFSVYTWYFGDLAFAYKTEKDNKDKLEEIILKQKQRGKLPSDNEFTQEEALSALFKKEEKLSGTEIIKRLNENHDTLTKSDIVNIFQDSITEKKELQERLTDEKVIESKLSKKVENRVKNIAEFRNKTTLAYIPFMGTTSTITDFIFLLYLLSLGLIFWLRKVLEFTRNVLKEIFNFPSLEETSIEISIPSLFYLILPSNDNIRFYKYLEYTVLLFLFSIVTFVFTNFFDIFINHHAYDLPLIDLPGFSYWQIFWSVGIYAIILSIIMYAVLRIKDDLIDIRNLIVLIKWQRTSFFPQLYSLFQENDLYLKKYQNRMEYRNVGISKKMRLCIYANVYNPYVLDDIRFINARVNLAKSLKKFFAHNKTEEYKRTFVIDKYIRRILTVEENKMRDYVKAIFCDKNYEDELSKEFEKCITAKVHQIKDFVTKPKLVDEKVLAVITTLVADGQTREALQKFNENVDEQLEEIKELLILLTARFERIHGHYLKGIIPIETYEMEVNIINNSILEATKYFR